MSVSDAPAIELVVDTKDNTPEPFVPRTCPFEPSAVGSVNVKFDAIVSGALRPTKFEPLSVSSIIFKVPPDVDPLPTLKSAGVAVAPSTISV